MTRWQYILDGVIAAAGQAQQQPMQDATQRAEADWTTRINALGAEGWELVAEHRTATVNPSNGVATVTVRGTFKRAITTG